MATEKLKFKIKLFATMWDKPPHAEIFINDQSLCKKNITGTEDKPDLIEFEYELEEEHKCEFRDDIRRRDAAAAAATSAAVP